MSKENNKNIINSIKHNLKVGSSNPKINRKYQQDRRYHQKNQTFQNPIKPVDITYTKDLFENRNSVEQTKKNKKRNRIILCSIFLIIIIVVIAGVFFWQKSVNEEESKGRTIKFYVNVPNYDQNKSTKIPVQVTGIDINDNDVDEITFYDTETGSISYRYGNYDLKFPASPLVEDGTFYDAPSESIHVDVAKNIIASKGEIKTNKTAVFSKTDPKKLSKEKIESSESYALEDKNSAAQDKNYENKVAKYRETTLQIMRESQENVFKNADEAFTQIIDQYKHVINYTSTLTQTPSGSLSSVPQSAEDIAKIYQQVIDVGNNYLVVSGEFPKKYAKFDFDNDGNKDLVIMGSDTILAVYKFNNLSKKVEYDKQNETYNPNNKPKTKICWNGYVFVSRENVDTTQSSTLYKYDGGPKTTIEEIKATTENGVVTKVTKTLQDNTTTELNANDYERASNELKNRYSERTDISWINF